MSTTPDSSAAFDADAARTTPTTGGDTDVEALRRRVQELEAAQPAPTPEVEVLDPVGAPGAGGDGAGEVTAAHQADVAGDTWRFHAPKPTALMAFGLGTANRRNGQLMIRTMSQFLAFHLVDDDYDRLLERMADPADAFGDDDFGALVNAVVDAAADTPEARAPKNGPVGRH